MRSVGAEADAGPGGGKAGRSGSCQHEGAGQTLQEPPLGGLNVLVQGGAEVLVKQEV